MNFQAILDGIESEGKLQIRQIEKEARQKIDAINMEAERIAGLRRERILFEGRARLNRESALIEQQAAVQALQIHADARQKLIEKVLQHVRESFPEIRDRETYRDFLLMTMKEVIRSLSPSLLENQKIALRFDPRDKKIAEELIRGLKEPVKVQFDLETSGGCQGESEDGSVIVLNTIESRFDHAGQIIQQKLSVFFEEKVSAAQNGSV